MDKSNQKQIIYLNTAFVSFCVLFYMIAYYILDFRLSEIGFALISSTLILDLVLININFMCSRKNK